MKKRNLVLILGFVFIIFFIFAGRLLVVDQQPVQSDVIIVLGGGSAERELAASKLYKTQYADKIILSNGGTRGNPSTEKGQLEISWLEEFGVPDAAIIPELESQSTYGNAVFSKRVMEANHFHSAIVVSSSYHMRRSQYIYNREFKDSGIKLTYVSAEVPNYNPKMWWATSSGWGYTVSEYKKLIGYWIVYGIFNNKDLYN